VYSQRRSLRRSFPASSISARTSPCALRSTTANGLRSAAKPSGSSTMPRNESVSKLPGRSNRIRLGQPRGALHARAIAAGPTAPSIARASRARGTATSAAASKSATTANDFGEGRKRMCGPP